MSGKAKPNFDPEWPKDLSRKKMDIIHLGRTVSFHSP
jgi:hypothetical protein